MKRLDVEKRGDDENEEENGEEKGAESGDDEDGSRAAEDDSSCVDDNEAGGSRVGARTMVRAGTVVARTGAEARGKGFAISHSHSGMPTVE